jgi:hypothetical protein
MAAINATPFPVYGQAYRMPCVFRDINNNLITGWTSASAEAYPDNGAGTSATIAESPVSTGVGYIDLSAAQMTCSMCLVVGTVSNTNYTAYTAAVFGLRLGQFTGRWDEQALLRFEQMLKDILYNSPLYGSTQDGALLQMLNEDQSVHFAGSVVQNNTTAIRTVMQ